jgi:hypothetical protein
MSLDIGASILVQLDAVDAFLRVEPDPFSERAERSRGPIKHWVTAGSAARCSIQPDTLSHVLADTDAYVEPPASPPESDSPSSEQEVLASWSLDSV